MGVFLRLIFLSGVFYLLYYIFKNGLKWIINSDDLLTFNYSDYILLHELYKKSNFDLTPLTKKELLLFSWGEHVFKRRYQGKRFSTKLLKSIYDENLFLINTLSYSAEERLVLIACSLGEYIVKIKREYASVFINTIPKYYLNLKDGTIADSKQFIIAEQLNGQKIIELKTFDELSAVIGKQSSEIAENERYYVDVRTFNDLNKDLLILLSLINRI